MNPCLYRASWLKYDVTQAPLCCPDHTVMEPKQITFELLMSGAETCTRAAYSHVSKPCRNITDNSHASVKCCWWPSDFMWKASSFCLTFPSMHSWRTGKSESSQITKCHLWRTLWSDDLTGCQICKSITRSWDFFVAIFHNLGVARSHSALLS